MNSITKMNITYLPRLCKMLYRLGDASVFSKLNLKTGFHQMIVKPKRVENTGINTKCGLFEHFVIRMGL